MNESSLLSTFGAGESRAMVAAALQVLSVLASDPVRRHDIVAPWAWSLRQRARELEQSGARTAAAQARSIARVAEAIALGSLTSEELAREAGCVEVSLGERQEALGTLMHAMAMS